jgi:hypothetical protein
MNNLYRICVSDPQNDSAYVTGYLTDEEISLLRTRCERAGVNLSADPIVLPVGYDAVLDYVDTQRSQDIRSILQRAEQD